MKIEEASKSALAIFLREPIEHGEAPGNPPSLKELEEAIGEIVAKASSIQIADPEDALQIKTADQARLEMFRLRGRIKKAAESAAAPVQAEIQKWKDALSAMEQTRDNLANPVHEEEKRLKKAIEDAKAKAKRMQKEREEQAARRYSERAQFIFDKGGAMVGDAYQLGRVQVKPLTIQEATEEKWAVVCDAIQQEADRLEEEKREKEAERARLLAIEEENKALRRQLEEMKAKEPAPDRAGKVVPNTEAEPQTEMEQHSPAMIDAMPLKENATPAHAIPGGGGIPKEPAPKAEAEQTASKEPFRVSPPHEPANKSNPADAAPLPSDMEAEKYASMGGSGAPHFSKGFKKGVEWAKEAAVGVISEKKYKTVGELTAKIMGL